MSRVEMESIYQRAINKFGRNNQVLKSIEELSELTIELSRKLSGMANDTLICGEIADVEIMISQLRWIFDSAVIDAYKKLKLERLQKLIDPNAIPPQRTG
jgi:hypothetical protein